MPRCQGFLLFDFLFLRFIIVLWFGGTTPLGTTSCRRCILDFRGHGWAAGCLIKLHIRGLHLLYQLHSGSRVCPHINAHLFLRDPLGYNHKQKTSRNARYTTTHQDQAVSFTRICSWSTVLILSKWPQFSLTSFVLSLQKAKTFQPLRFCTPTYPCVGYAGGARKHLLCQCHS